MNITFDPAKDEANLAKWRVLAKAADDRVRVISLRKANAREVTGYDQALQELRVSDPDA